VARAVFVVLLVVIVTGCASLGRRGVMHEDMAACREFARQGAAAMENGHWAEAEALLRRAVDAAPKDSEPHRYLAEALWHRGAADDALAQMDEAVKLEPADASLVVRAGEMCQAVGAIDQALAHADQAIRLDTTLASAWALRGRVYWQKDERDRALADLQRALQYAPDRPDLLQDIAVLYRERGQSARALAALHHLLDSYSPGEEPQLSLLLEGQTLVDLGRPSQAAASLAMAAQRGPPNAEIYCQLAQAELAAGDYTAATSAAQQALAVDATHQASRQLLAQLAGKVGPDAAQRR
jgi:tetratricopeptide (TPR) repeat protein